MTHPCPICGADCGCPANVDTAATDCTCVQAHQAARAALARAPERLQDQPASIPARFRDRIHPQPEFDP